MGGPIDKGEFYEILAEIEEGMGYLKGNELAYKYLREASNAAYHGQDNPDGTHFETFHLPSDFTFPCPYGDFQVHPWQIFPFTLIISDDDKSLPSTGERFVEDVQRNAVIAWKSGADWANGLASYLGDLCAQFLKPDTGEMLSSCIDLRNQVLRQLDAPARADWADIGALLDSWEGQAAYAFKTFYNNYASSVAIYALFSGYVFAGMAAATKIVDGTQVGALHFVRSVRDALREQLKHWAQFNLWPSDPPKTPAWLAKTEQLAKDSYSLLDHVPVVSTVKGYVDKGVSIADSVEKIAIDLGADPPHDEPPFDAMSSDEIYNELTSKLTKTLSDYHAAMDSKVHAPASTDPSQAGDTPFSADSALAQLQQEKDRYDFTLPDVGDQSLSPGNHYPS